MTDEGNKRADRFVVGLAIYAIVLCLVIIYVLISVWPDTVPMEEGVSSLAFGFWAFDASAESRLLIIVIASGALGSYVHLATSLVDYVGNRRLQRSWVLWYILRPFVGVSLAIILYYVVRGGLTGGGAGELNLYGMAAIAGMTGLFSKQATDKLREVFDQLFKTEKQSERADPLPPTAPDNDGDE